MNITHSIILGIVEGITEFLPISSTFHLIWTSTLLNLKQTEFIKLFEVFIQGGAILAVVFLYWQEVLRNFSLFKKLIVSFIPTAVVGLVLYKIIKGIFFESTITMTVIFILVGVLFLIVEYLIKKGKIVTKREIESMTYREAITVGLYQSLAVMPGVSRAGSVMFGMMSMGFRREEAAKYSFMLAIPTILAASALDLIKMRDVVIANSSRLDVLIIGFVVAFISALFVVKWLIGYLQTNTLKTFGWYRIVAGIILLLILWSSR
ncbi:undecaprenyl-diphosphatase UppP [soil metagenome]